MPEPHVIYECGICGCYHPWDWNDDCRDDENRFGSPEDYIEKTHCDSILLEVRSMDDRVLADLT
jgi:hypothetical protein